MDRLRELLAEVREIRKSLYPPGWKYDPLLKIEEKLKSIIREGVRD